MNMNSVVLSYYPDITQYLLIFAVFLSKVYHITR
jgi:hypothetical protein